MTNTTTSTTGPTSTNLFPDNRYAALLSPIPGAEMAALREMRGTERIGEPFAYEIKLITEQPIRQIAPVVGTAMTIGLKLEGGDTRYFNGLVTSFRFVSIEDTRRANYVAQVRPWLTLLRYRQNCRLFQNKTALEIIQAIFAEYPSARFENRTRAANMRVRALCVQWNETDLAFVSRLMEQEGIYYFFTHTIDTHTLVLANDMSAHTRCTGNDLIALHLNLTRAQIHNDIIYSWHDTAELQSDLVLLNDYDFKKPQSSLLKLEPVPQLSTSGTLEPRAAATQLQIYNYPGNYREPMDGAAYARVRAEELACRISRSRLEATARNLAPGYTFRAGNPYDNLQKTSETVEAPRTFLLVGGTFSIVVDAGDQRKFGEAHFLFNASLEALLATIQYRPPRTTPKALIAGPQTALVVGVPGEDITTDQYGRIKVQFYWDREGQKNENSSPFIRVAQNWAGRSWGGLVTPRIGQEVVVEFLNGDPDWPIITGTVYNASNMPPYELPAEATRSTFKTRSSVAAATDYNELRFEDRAGSEEVYLRAQKDLNGDVQNNFTVVTGSNAKVTAKTSTTIEAAEVPGSALASSVEVESGGQVTVSCSSNILLKVGPLDTPLASIAIDETGITMTGLTIKLSAPPLIAPPELQTVLPVEPPVEPPSIPVDPASNGAA
jgi:type VI secretion system secreted protein VgrG